MGEHTIAELLEEFLRGNDVPRAVDTHTFDDILIESGRRAKAFKVTPEDAA